VPVGIAVNTVEGAVAGPVKTISQDATSGRIAVSAPGLPSVAGDKAERNANSSVVVSGKTIVRPELPMETEPATRRVLGRASFWWSLFPGVVAGSMIFLFSAGWRHAMVEQAEHAPIVSAPLVNSALELILNRWRQAELSRLEIERDLRVTLEIMRVRGMADQVVSQERRIAEKESEIVAIEAEIVEAVLRLVAWHRADSGQVESVIDTEVEAALAAGRRLGAEVLRKVKAILVATPSDSAQGKAHVVKGVHDALASFSSQP
jgi:hypothetical protein